MPYTNYEIAIESFDMDFSQFSASQIIRKLKARIEDPSFIEFETNLVALVYEREAHAFRVEAVLSNFEPETFKVEELFSLIRGSKARVRDQHL